MGHKRTRNHYPRLPDAVQNLLALHSLRAIAHKEPQWDRGACTGWTFDVIRDDGKAIFVAGRRQQPMLFQLRGNEPLETWIKEVERWTTERVEFFQGMDWGQTEARDLTWLDESGELEDVDFETLHGTYSSKSK